MEFINIFILKYFWDVLLYLNFKFQNIKVVILFIFLKGIGIFDCKDDLIIKSIVGFRKDCKLFVFSQNFMFIVIFIIGV